MNFALLLLPDFSLILCGLLLCRATPLNRSVWEPVERLVYFFLFPVLLFHSIIKNPFDWKAASHLMGAGLSLALLAIVLAHSLPYWPWVGRRLDRSRHAASAQVAFRFNSFIALALADRVAGPAGTPLVAVLIGTLVPVYNVAAVWPMVRHAQLRLGRELLRNPLIIATVAGLVSNLMGLRIPEWLAPSIGRIGQSSLALGLMAAGAGMQFGAMASGKWLGALTLAIKHLCLPLIALAMAHLWSLSAAQAQVLLMFSAVPTASSCYVLAARMGYDGPYVAGLVTLSTLLGMFSLPLALGLLAPP